MIPQPQEKNRRAPHANHFSVDRSAVPAGQYQVGIQPRKENVLLSEALITRRPTALLRNNRTHKRRRYPADWKTTVLPAIPENNPG